jgi:hypothetical protein
MAAESSEKLRFRFVRGFLLLFLEVLSPWRQDALHPRIGDLLQKFGAVAAIPGALWFSCTRLSGLKQKQEIASNRK